MQPFQMVRIEDKSGVSGTGVVAEGVIFSSGKVTIAWLTQYQSVAVYDSIEDALAIHGHGGKTVLKLQDGSILGQAAVSKDNEPIFAQVSFTNKW